ncbi:hypothetical protein D8780_01940 [Notoacmeibacter ruber]|uniref:Uncharacterized protein n=2 Tax=Notoacmeibacter ruber TaxID=2670375 RepID=A0A3L7J8U7_9HYPH|nr:hypothetical protein D8780_01940 [Notoacmeibacter ruber]
MDKEGVSDPAARELRRQRLLNSISEIEKDYLPAANPAHETAGAEPFPHAERVIDREASRERVATRPRTASLKGDKQEPRLDHASQPHDPEGAGRREPSFEEPAELAEPAGPDADFYPDRMSPEPDSRAASRDEPDRRFRRRSKRGREKDGRPKRRPYAWMMLILTLLVFALLGVGFWALSNADYEFVLERFLQETDPGEDYTPEARLGAGTDDRTQFTLYDPAADGEPAIEGDLSAEIENTGQLRLLHVEGGGEAAAIVIEIPQQQLSELSGQPYTVAMRARSEAEGGATLLVSCDFASLGDCGSRRYEAEATAGDLLFAGTMEGGAPGADGAIRIALPNESSEVDIFSVTILLGDD